MNEMQDATFRALETLSWRLKKILPDGTIIIENDSIGYTGIIDTDGKFFNVKTLIQYKTLKKLEPLGWYVINILEDDSLIIKNINDDKTAVIFENGNIFSEKTFIESRFIN